ncbi:unnamed protein product [Brassica oleracea var. botrytis]
MKGSNAKDILVNNSNKEMSEMQTKNQVEDSIIQESLLTCIDLANSDLHQSALLLKKACLDSGFFYVINHGISKEVTDKAFEQSKKFFALPSEEKMKVLKNEKHRGYTPLYDQIPDPENQVQGDHKEGYYIGSEVPRDDPQWDRPFYGLNTWPNPDVLPGWRETMEEYHQEALRVCKAIAKLLALSLDLDADYFDSPEMLGKPISTLRLLHYEGISDPSKGIYGTGAHSDYGMITLLATDGVMGLQICKDRNAKLQKWEYVPSIEGAIVVNLGDMMERWSNGLFSLLFFFTIKINIAPGYFKWTESIFNSIFRGTESRLHNRVSSNLPVRKQSSQISSDQMFGVSHPTLRRIAFEVQQLQKTNLSEVCSPPSFHYPWFSS